MGVYTFVFGWNINRWTKTKQFWSVPFVSKEKRRKYLRVVKEDIRRDLGLWENVINVRRVNLHFCLKIGLKRLVEAVNSNGGITT